MYNVKRESFYRGYRLSYIMLFECGGYFLTSYDRPVDEGNTYSEEEFC